MIYKVKAHIKVDEYINLLFITLLDARKPTKDIYCINGTLKHTNLIVQRGWKIIFLATLDRLRATIIFNIYLLWLFVKNFKNVGLIKID